MSKLNIKNINSYAFGYYRAGDQAFFTKEEALVYASVSKKNPEWIFHDDVYASLDWTKCPDISLRQIYKERAQQIRDEYDYVILNFSGGCDSWTVLHSFLSNNIHVDEIYTRWALKADPNMSKPNNLDFSATNVVSEYTYAVKPVLEDIQKKFPRIKITVDDYSDEFSKDLTEKKFIGVEHGMAASLKWIRKTAGELEAVRNNKSVAIVHGMDKINCKIVDGNFVTFFQDTLLTGAYDSDPERNIEMFYWSRKMPLIPVLQAHKLKSFYENSFWDVVPIRMRYSHICYPDYDINTFQVEKFNLKIEGTLFHTDELWLRKYNPRYVESWTWCANQYVKFIDDKFLSRFMGKAKLGLNMMTTRSYLVGPFNQSNTVAAHNSKFNGKIGF